MNRFLLAFSVTALSILSAGLFVVSSAKASSPYDDFFVNRQAKSMVFCGTDWTTSYLDFLRPNANNPKIQFSASYPHKFDSFYNSWLQNLANDGSWGVSMIGDYDENQQGGNFTLIFRTSPQKVTTRIGNHLAYYSASTGFLYFDSWSPIQQVGTMKTLSVNIKCRTEASQIGNVQVQSQSSNYEIDLNYPITGIPGTLTDVDTLSLANNAYTIPAITTHVRTVFYFSGGPVIYPENYVGPFAPSGLYTPDELIPDFKWSLTPQGKLTVRYQNNIEKFIDGTYNKENYQWKITLDKTTETDILDSPYFVDIDDEFLVNLPDFSNYNVYIDVVPTNTNFPNIPIKRTGWEFKHEGLYKEGSTGECDGGMCFDYSELAPDYEECDLIDIMCHFRNAGKFIAQTFKWLFIPDFSRLNQSFVSLAEHFKSSLGLFWAPFDIFIQTFQVLTGNSANPTGQYCSLGSWQMFGRGQSATIELCRWRDQLPALWSTMQLAIQASISISMLYVFWSLFRTDILGLSKRDNDEEDSTSDDSEEFRWHDDRTGETGPWERRRK